MAIAGAIIIEEIADRLGINVTSCSLGNWEETQLRARNGEVIRGAPCRSPLLSIDLPDPGRYLKNTTKPAAPTAEGAQT